MSDANPTLGCTRCRRALPAGNLNAEGWMPCPSCGVATRAAVFPALLTGGQPGSTGQDAMTGEDAACFHHPARKAVAICELCGRFLCSLCDVNLAGRRLCPACIESGARRHTIRDLVRSRVLYDEIALLLAVLPLLITALLAIGIAVRHWSTPGSLLRQSRRRLGLATLLALLQLAGWALVFAFLADA